MYYLVFSWTYLKDSGRKAFSRSNKSVLCPNTNRNDYFSIVFCEDIGNSILKYKEQTVDSEDLASDIYYILILIFNLTVHEMSLLP